MVGRFINADDIDYLGADGSPLSYNLFAYCQNNPTNMADDSGNLAFFVATGILGAVVGGIVGYAKTGTWQGALAGAAVGGVVGLAGGAGTAYLLGVKATASAGAVSIAAKLNLAGVGTKGYLTFKAFKTVYGNAGEGKAWHHIVGQTVANIQRFGAQVIHNANNLVKIDHGAGTLHNMITAHYNSIQPYTNGMVVHKWLADQSFREQFTYGLELLYRLSKELGAVIEYAS